MPSPEQTRKIKTRFEILSVPFYTVKEDDSRGAKHGRERWQYDHWKAKAATRRRIQEKLPFYFALMADRQTITRISMESRTDKNILNTLTTLQLLILHTMQPGQNDQVSQHPCAEAP